MILSKEQNKKDNTYIMNNAIIFDIQRGSFVDGPGIRTTVFFKGCNLRCAWCHNPESQSTKPQMMFYKDKCIGCGKCKEVCPHNLKQCELCGKCELICPRDARKIVGKEYTVSEVFYEIIKDKDFFDNSCGGVTFSGGECMLQIDFLCEILKKCKENAIHTAVDTAGSVKWEYFEKILPFTDLFLYDIKAYNSEIHKKWTGVDNKLIFENLAKLLKRTKVWIRIPVIPDVNIDEKEIALIKEFFVDNGYPEKIELLPYHKMGENKFSALGKNIKTFSVPSKEKVESLKKYLSE